MQLSRWLALKSWAILSFAVCLMCLVLGCRGSSDALVFSVTFESASGLERGMPVFHRGLEIGEVTDVGLDPQGLVEVVVEIEPEFRTAVARNSVIRSESYGLRRRLRLTIEDGSGDRVPVEDGDVLAGRPRVLEDMLTKLQEGAVAAWQKVGESASELQGELAEAARQGQEEFLRVRREQAPELRRQAEEVRRQLEEAGLTEEAKKYWTEFEAWLDKLEGSEGESAGPPPELPER